MNTAQLKATIHETAAQSLFDFAVDLEDVKKMMAAHSKDAPIKPHIIEYELKILRIISVGWSIAFHLENHPLKEPLGERFWQTVHEFSKSVSETTGLLIGKNVDYFQVLRERLETYVAALGENKDATEPAAVIGPVFARLCGDADDVHLIMTGAKMFVGTVFRVKEYLKGLKQAPLRRGAG